MTNVVVDTSVLVGLMNPADVWHEKARGLLSDIQEQKDGRLIIFDCVLAECVSVVCRRLQDKKRTIEMHSFLNTFEAKFPLEMISWILPDVPKMYTAVLELMRQSGGQLNFNDALIALACQQHELKQIASFDSDFDLVPWLDRIGA